MMPSVMGLLQREMGKKRRHTKNYTWGTVHKDTSEYILQIAVCTRGMDDVLPIANSE